MPSSPIVDASSSEISITPHIWPGANLTVLSGAAIPRC